jgi:glyoxylase-like metal-dependent hydrolase (beta-lactamase superfamily II)
MTELTRRTIMTGAVAAAAAGPLAASLPAVAAAPPAGKQAPGFYRYKVGDFEISVVTDGTTTTPIPPNYVTNQPKEALDAAMAAAYLPANVATHWYTPIVVNTGSRLVVIDTGVGQGAFQQSKGAAGQFHSNLQAAGIDRNAVDVVIISHLHGDHINGLLDAGGKPAFPNAEVMIPAADWAYWTDDGNASRAPDLYKGQFGNVKRVFDALGKKPAQYEGGKELVPGITSIAAPGHTPGHMAYTVASGSGRLLVQVDITAGMAPLFVRNPGWHFVFDIDQPLAEQTRRKLYDMALADKLPVQGFHFPFPALARVEKDGDGYRLVPAHWSTML